MYKKQRDRALLLCKTPAPGRPLINLINYFHKKKEALRLFGLFDDFLVDDLSLVNGEGVRLDLAPLRDFLVNGEELPLIDETDTEGGSLCGGNLQRGGYLGSDSLRMLRDIRINRVTHRHICKCGLGGLGRALFVARIQFGNRGLCERNEFLVVNGSDDGVVEFSVSHIRPLSPTLRSGRAVFIYRGSYFSLPFCIYIISHAFAFVKGFFKLF